MKLLSFILGMTGWTLFVQAQIQNERNRSPPINPDLIYFADNRPSVESKLGGDRTTVEVQKSVETPQPDSYAQAVYANQNLGLFTTLPQPQNLNNGLPPPNTNLRPPTFDPSNSNYFTGFNENTNNVVRVDESAGQNVPVIPKEFKINNVTLALSNFGLNVMKSIASRGSNVVISPFSIAELLSLLQQGALGLTQQQISEALQMAPHTSLAAFKNVNDNLKKSHNVNSHNILRVANNIYVADAFELNPTFKNIAMRAYDSEVTPMQFQRAQESVTKINKWVSDKTNNKIPELLTSDAVSEITQVVLVNAVYFKGLWEVRFRPESTLPRDFYANGVTKKKIPFMRMRKIFKSGVDPTNQAQVITIPFEKEQYSLMLVLPSAVSSLDTLISTITGPQLASYNNFPLKEVDLEIPKFTVRADTDLSPVLRRLGVTNAFGAQSELSGLGTFRTYSPQISSALHTAMLSIDEDGGTASAATSFAVVALSYDDASVSFKANRPFLAVLWDNESALPLFMARIQDI